MDTPQSMARHLAAYITDDSTVAAYVRANFSTDITAQRVAKIRGSLPRGRVIGDTAKANMGGGGRTEGEREAIEGSRRLRDALWAHYRKYPATFGEVGLG